jgi:hypothetical protein
MSSSSKDFIDDSSTTVFHWDISNNPYITYPESVVSASNDTIAETIAAYPLQSNLPQDKSILGENYDEDDFFSFLNE